jgi:ribonuclease-3 family protein
VEESIDRNAAAGGRRKAAMYSPLTLAYLGDSVLDLWVKEHFVRKANQQVQKYHKEVTGVV